MVAGTLLSVRGQVGKSPVLPDPFLAWRALPDPAPANSAGGRAPPVRVILSHQGLPFWQLKYEPKTWGPGRAGGLS
eukprot:5065466-Lingulodinium_polyedra.AAC.1